MKEALWVRGMVEEHKISQSFVSMFCDDQSTIHLYKNHAYHERIKHIDKRMYWIRDIIENDKVKIEKVHKFQCYRFHDQVGVFGKVQD